MVAPKLLLPQSVVDLAPSQTAFIETPRVTLKDDVNDRQTQRGLLDRFRYAPVRMPRTQSELFQLLAMFNPHIGWNAFAEMIDFASVTPTHIHQVVLGRYPTSIDQALPHPGYDARQHFREALVSREFRSHLLAAFLHAYPSKGRDVFIHVPKCAGTDLILNLGSRSLPIPKMLEVDGWVDDNEFLEIIGGLARAAMSGERFFVYGHMELGKYVDVAGIRPDDTIFTVLRDPVDLMVSQANYVVGRLRQDPFGREPDSAEYLHRLGLTSLPEQLSDAELKTLTVKILLNPTVTEPNRACYYLGDGSGTLYATALENLISHNVEITTTKNYDRWLRQRWGITESSHHNQSQPILGNAEARRLCGTYLAAATREDQKLYELVSWGLLTTGAASVTGQELARLAGPALADALRANKCPSLPVVAQETSSEQKILVAECAKDVEMYLARVSVDGPETASIETIIETGFGVKMGGEPYRQNGWARPEASFTWTAAEESTLRLPVLPSGGRFIIRLVASPFIVKPVLPCQQLVLEVNGVRLGGCEIKDLSVIEAELPPMLLKDGAPLTVTLRLPTATQPNTVSSSADDRLLALAVRSLAVFRVTASD
jgi:hypothetical protein